MGQTGGPVTPKEAWVRRVVAPVRTQECLLGMWHAVVGDSCLPGAGLGQQSCSLEKDCGPGTSGCSTGSCAHLGGPGDHTSPGAETCRRRLGSVSGRWSKPSGSPSRPPPELSALSGPAPQSLGD